MDNDAVTEAIVLIPDSIEIDTIDLSDIIEYDDLPYAEERDFAPESLIRFKKRLIREVRRRSVLYDPLHKQFSNAEAQETAWNEIAKKLQVVDVDVLKNTWADLRYDYQRYVRRLRKFFKSNGKVGKRKRRPRLELETEMIFLWRFVADKCYAPLPYVEKCESADLEKNAASDDDVVLLEDEPEVVVIDVDDEPIKLPRLKHQSTIKLNSEIREMVELIKVYSELYDTEHKYYNDYKRKGIIWHAIANELNSKATKLMKSWLQLQTRYEWEINQNSSELDDHTDLEKLLDFLKPYITKNPNTVYKQSHYLKQEWHEPISYFKSIEELLKLLAKSPEVIKITDYSIHKIESFSLEEYFAIWNNIGKIKVLAATAGQCEATWLILRLFYWELMTMRKNSYQLQDKWYFESIITTLYANVAVLPNTVIAKPIPVSLDEDKITSSVIETVHSPRAKLNYFLQQTGNPKSKQKTSIQAQAHQKLQSSKVQSQTQISAKQNLQLPQPQPQLQIQSHPQQHVQQTPQLQQAQAQIKILAHPQPQIQQISQLQQAQPQFQIQVRPQPQSQAKPPALHLLPIQPRQMFTPMNFKLSSLPETGQTQYITNQTSITAKSKVLTEEIKTPKIASAKSLAPSYMQQKQQQQQQNVFAPLLPKGLQIKPIPTTMQPTIVSATSLNVAANLTPNTPITPITVTTSTNNNTLTSMHVDLPYKLPKHTSVKRVVNVTEPLSTSTVDKARGNSETISTSSDLPITGLNLNQNEILIELISSKNGNQLVVFGPPLAEKYSLSMRTTVAFIRAIMSIPLLFNKKHNHLPKVNAYWAYVSKQFNMPPHVCKACWNFLAENFKHFPQIAPMEELMQPFKCNLPVWKESNTLFNSFNVEAVAMGLLEHRDLLPNFMADIGKFANAAPRETGRKLSYLIDWPILANKYPQLQTNMVQIWLMFRKVFMQYLDELEECIDNKWPENWWRTLEKMQFLLDERHHDMEPLYYILRNKIIEEIERCVQKESASEIISELQTHPDIDAYNLMACIRRHPEIYQKCESQQKVIAWHAVAKEMNTTVTICRFAFQRALKNYRLYVARDPANRCRINYRYFKQMAEIYRTVKPAGKINVKTPLELNQSVGDVTESSETVFPERFVPEINMDKCKPSLVMKNWAYGFGSWSVSTELRKLFNKYRPYATIPP